MMNVLLGALLVVAASATPPMGWNSWDCFQGNLNETGALAVASAMKEYLLPSGYDTLTIDEFWYTGDCQVGSGCIDSNGRPQPDLTRWPSAVNGSGFKPIVDKIHALGLKVGIHTLRGSISAAAIAAKSPILGGGGATVDQIVNASAGPCSWNTLWYAVNMSHPAATAWFDSVYGQYAEWGIDLIKNDCIFAQNMVANNIKAISGAITKTGREMTYSLSPGGEGNMERLVADATEIAGDVSMYRITGDWHGGNMDWHFEVAEALAPFIGLEGIDSRGSFPDLDMLHPYNNASSDPNFRAQMTLWAIARSPLVYGADIRNAKSADEFALLTNPEVLAVTAGSSGNRPVDVKDDNTIVWTANAIAAHGTTYYVAFIKRKQVACTATVSYAELGLPVTITQCTVRDLWSRKVVTPSAGTVTWAQPGGEDYDGGMFSLTNCS